MDVLPSEYYQVAYVDIGQVVDSSPAFGAMDGSGPAAAATPGPATGSPANIRRSGQFLPTGRDGRIERDPLHRGASVLT